jgi:acetylornithine deacetylase/succinyl-diaminopimelate desuccinylase-like protein
MREFEDANRSFDDGGHRPNALPQRAHASVNCRILPNVPIAGVQAEIAKVLADDKITLAPVGEPGMQSPPPPLSARIMEPVQAVAGRIWPGVAIVPTMWTG